MLHRNIRMIEVAEEILNACLDVTVGHSSPVIELVWWNSSPFVTHACFFFLHFETDLI